MEALDYGKDHLSSVLKSTKLSTAFVDNCGKVQKISIWAKK